MTLNCKLFRSGSSLVVSLPAEILDALNLTEGSEVDIALASSRDAIVVSPTLRPIGEVSPEFDARVNAFIEAYRPALEALSQR
jgi:antitoxin component of MazEF toxin-antitoxin module